MKKLISTAPELQLLDSDKDNAAWILDSHNDFAQHKLVNKAINLK